MIPTRQQLTEIARRDRGSISEIPFPILLSALAVEERTVMLEIRRHQLFKRIVFENGVPVDCRSNLVHETLGRFMVSRGVLSENQHRTVLNEAAVKGRRLGEILREKGLINSYDLYRLLQENLASKLLDCFSWPEGEYELHTEMPTVRSSLKLKVPQLLVTGIAKFAAQDAIDLEVSCLIGKRLALHPEPLFPLQEIKLTAQQVRIAMALNQPLRIDELLDATKLSHDYLARQLYALAVVGVVVPEERIPAGLRRGKFSPRRTAKPIPVDQAPPRPQAVPEPELPPDFDEEAFEKVRNEVMTAFLSYRRKDAFDLLDAPEDAPAPVIRVRYLRYAERFAPWVFHGEDFQPLAEKAQDLFVAGAQAFALLMDDERREQLLASRRSRAQKEAQAADTFAIRTDLLDPELQYRKGQQLMTQGSYHEAVKLLRFACDCDPQNGDYRADLAFSRYMISPKVNSRRAIDDLQETLRIDPQCGLAMYYLGEILVDQSEWAAGETYLRRAAKLMAPDRRPVEALRALAKKIMIAR